MIEILARLGATTGRPSLAESRIVIYIAVCQDLNGLCEQLFFFTGDRRVCCLYIAVVPGVNDRRM